MHMVNSIGTNYWRLAVAAHAALWDGWRAEGLRIECKSALSMYKEHPEVREWMD